MTSKYSAARRLRVLSYCLFGALSLTLSAPAQTLAHPNWVGNGMSTDPWWQHAVIFRIRGAPEHTDGAKPNPVDYKHLYARILAFRSIGFDALLLPAPEIPGQGGAASAAQPASQSEVDQLDDLIRLASGRGVRILLTLHPASASDDLSGVARFWLSRGIAGFHVLTPKGASPAEVLGMVQSLRRLTAGAVGQRIVISDLDPGVPDSAGVQPAAPIVRRTGTARGVRTTDIAPQLELDSRLDQVELKAGSLRGLLAQTSGQPNLLVNLSSGGVPSGSVPSGSVPSGSVPSGSVPSGSVSSGSVPSGSVSSGSVSSGSVSSGSVSSGGAVGDSPAISLPADRAPFARIAATLALLGHPAALVDSDVHLVLDPAPEHTDADDGDQPKPAAPAQPQPGVYLPYKPYVPPSKSRSEPVQPAPKDPLTLWYKQLAALHHGNAAIRAGATTFLDFDGQNALVWVSRAGAPSAGAPLVVACNLSGSPVQLSLRTPLEGLGLKGNYLRTLLRSDKLLGPQDLGTVTLPPYAVYIGELRR